MKPRADRHEALMSAVGATWVTMLSAMPGAWTLERDGTIAGASGTPVAMMSGVLVLSSSPAPTTVAELLDKVAASGLPHNIQLRPSAGPEIVALAESAGMSFHHETPLMALEQLDGVEQALKGCPLVLRKIEPSEAELHWRIAAEVFSVSDDVMQRVAGPAVLSLPAVSCYVGELDGLAVATSVACLVDGHLAIFNVGTSPQQRRRGYGAAVTAIAIRDGFTAGAHTAWLQSAPMGLGVYKRMGFALVESWRCWMRTSGSE